MFCRSNTIKQKVKLFNVLSLTQEIPDRELLLGQVSTVAEVLAPDVFEVGFSDNERRTFTELALEAEQLLILHYQPAMA